MPLLTPGPFCRGRGERQVMTAAGKRAGYRMGATQIVIGNNSCCAGVTPIIVVPIALT